MKTRLTILTLLISALFVEAVAGCGVASQTATTETLGPAPQETTISSSTINAPVVTASSTASAVATTTVAITQPPGFTVPLDPAVYPPIVAGVVTVILADGHFSPPIIKIPAGTIVEWQAIDHLGDHAVYGSDGVLWGPVIAWIPLDKTFSVPGTYDYRDMSSMGGIGTVIVY